MHHKKQRNHLLRKQAAIQLSTSYPDSDFPEVSFVFFDQLIFDQFMPWLPTNQGIHRFEALLDFRRDTYKNPVQLMAREEKRLGLEVPAKVKQIWDQTDNDGAREKKFHFSSLFEQTSFRDAKEEWYHRLIDISLRFQFHSFRIVLQNTKSGYMRKSLLAGSLRKIHEWEEALASALKQYPAEASIICRIYIAVRVFANYINIVFSGQYEDIPVPKMNLENCLSGWDTSLQQNGLTGMGLAFRTLVSANLYQMNASVSMKTGTQEQVGLSDQEDSAEQKSKEAKTVREDSIFEAWLDSKSICHHIGIGKSKLNELTKISGFPVNKLSHRHKFKLSQVENWLAQHPEELKYCQHITNNEK